MGSNVFYGCASGFTVYYLAGRTGFTNPWHGYPTALFTLPSTTTTTQPAATTTTSVSSSSTSTPTVPACVDNDGDGYGENCAAGPDCDDTVFGQGLITWYYDYDNDGYGKDLGASCTTPIRACLKPEMDGINFSELNTDCKDNDPERHPGATEACGDEIDRNCDGLPNNVYTFYRDADGDLFGDPNNRKGSCDNATPPHGYVYDSSDCNDGSDLVHPGAADDNCNGKDDDCDGTVDEGSGAQITYYRDADADTYGNAAVTLSGSGCTAPAGYVTNSTDCNDSNIAVHPGATETCNEVDDDCDGSTDESVCITTTTIAPTTTSSVIPTTTTTRPTTTTTTATTGTGCAAWLGDWTFTYNDGCDNVAITSVCNNEDGSNPACLPVKDGVPQTYWVCIAEGKRASDNQTIQLRLISYDTTIYGYYEATTAEILAGGMNTPRAEIPRDSFIGAAFTANTNVFGLQSGEKGCSPDCQPETTTTSVPTTTTSVCTGAAWTTMTSGTTKYLFGVWGNSASDVFAVGNSGTILHYNGTTWLSMTSGTTQELRGVWGSSGNDVFAVGYYGTILHYNGTSWSTMSSGGTAHLMSVWGSSGNDVFAVAQGGTILHYNGTTWSSMTSGTTQHLWDVWGNSGSDVFAVGYYGTIVHYNGTTWSSMPSGTTQGLNAVWGSSGNDVFVAGIGGIIVHYNGTT